MLILPEYEIPFDVRMPVLYLGSKESPSYYPADVCVVAAGQHYRGKIHPKQIDPMVEFARQKPLKSKTSITNKGLAICVLAAQSNHHLVRHTFQYTLSAS